MSRANLPLPDGYPELLDELKRTVADTRWRAQRVVNTELINHVLAHRTDHPGSPGDRDVRHLGHRPTLRRSPGGLSRLTRVGPRSLRYMRSFALAWPDEVWQQAAAKLPWGHIMVLLDKLDNPAERDWYAAQAVEHGWSRNVLLNQIMSGLHTRALGPPSPTTVSLQPRLADIPRLERDSGHDVTLDLRGVQGQDWAEPTQRAAYRGQVPGSGVAPRSPS